MSFTSAFVALIIIIFFGFDDLSKLSTNIILSILHLVSLLIEMIMNNCEIESRISRSCRLEIFTHLLPTYWNS